MVDIRVKVHSFLKFNIKRPVHEILNPQQSKPNVITVYFNTSHQERGLLLSPYKIYTNYTCIVNLYSKNILMSK